MSAKAIFYHLSILTALGCHRELQYSGPLAPLADSVLAKVESRHCRPVEEKPASDDRRLIQCTGLSSDTAVMVESRRIGGEVVRVTRRWTTPPPQVSSAYERLRVQLSSAHGAGEPVCLKEAGMGPPGTRWSQADYYILLLREITPNELEWSVAVGRPLYEASCSPGDLPVTLPVSESTPVGVRIDSVTIWLDSTRIGAAVKALGPKSALGRYDPYKRLFVACYRIQDGGVTYVLLKAGYADTGRVVEVVIGPDQDNMEPDLRCASLPHRSPRLSNSLGLKLGMTRTEVERLLGRSNDTTDFTQARGVFGAEYTMARIADDTSMAGAERAQHVTVTTNVGFHRDTLFKISIHRGEPLPRFVE